jgi:predicted ATPase
LRKAVLSLSKDEDISEVFSGQTLLDLILWCRSLKPGQRKRAVGDKFREIVIQSISEDPFQTNIRDNKGTDALEAVINNPYVESLEQGVAQTVQFFTSKIRYLGPIRADPQEIQRFAPSSELDDVGAKGQYAAAVYDANHNARIRYYNPLREQVEQDTLKVALDTWAGYLGVANEIKIQEAGQSGVSWQVIHMAGHKALPLTTVGVGVSQILPILVMGLLAPNDTLLLVEQPELHLHPSVQARLGDFFMGLAKCGKQCLIETHSENLVSQLRYHIVQAGGQEHSDCLVYFVDQDEQGAARFNPIEISPQGNILNWPDGFFDETMLQEDRITAASLKKRAKKTNNG